MRNIKIRPGATLNDRSVCKVARVGGDPLSELHTLCDGSKKAFGRLHAMGCAAVAHQQPLDLKAVEGELELIRSNLDGYINRVCI